MDLRPDVSREDCKAVLLDLANDVENVRGYGSGPDPRQREIYARKYLAWVDNAESRQRHLWVDDDWLTDLHTARWQALTSGNVAPHLVNGEIDFQSRRLRNLAAQVSASPLEPRSATLPPQSLSLEGLHQKVVAACSSLFDTEHYSEAIFGAFKVVEIAVREASGLDHLSGVPLMQEAMGDRAVLRMTGLSGQAATDEQHGMRWLFVGAMQGIRNPKAHGVFTLRDRQRALEYLAFASLLLRRLDDATPVIR